MVRCGSLQMESAKSEQPEPQQARAGSEASPEKDETEEMPLPEEQPGGVTSSEEARVEGNALFARGEWAAARDVYSQGIRLCQEGDELAAVLLVNSAAASIKLEDWTAAVDSSSAAIAAGAKNEKPLERRAFALSHIEDKLHEALKDYEELAKQFPDRNNYARHIQQLQPRVDAKNEAMKAEMIGKLKNLGDWCLKPFGMSTDSFEMTPNGQGGYSVQMKKN